MECPVSISADTCKKKSQVPEDIAEERYLVCPTRLLIRTSKGKKIFNVDQLATESAYHHSLSLVIHSTPKPSCLLIRYLQISHGKLRAHSYHMDREVFIRF